MGLGADQLRDKALLALEEVLQEARFAPVKRTFALQFALAYLWACRPGARTPFDEFWQALAVDNMWRFGAADSALDRIYNALGVKRDGEVAMTLWQRRYHEEKRP